MTKHNGYAVVEIQTGAVIERRHVLPMSPSPPRNPRGRLATFDRVGQEAAGYRCVELWEVERQSPHYVKGTQSQTLTETKLTVDPGWVFTGLAAAIDKAKSRIKEQAEDRILQKFPYWKQLSTILDEDPVNIEEMRLSIKAIRDHSNVLEGEIMGLSGASGTDEERATSIAAWQSHDWPGSA